MKQIVSAAMVVVLLSLFSGAAEPKKTATEIPPYDANWKPTRDLTRFFAKVRAGKPVTVAAIGGSVTTGHSWALIATDWLREQFPTNQIAFFNGAEGGRGPSYAIWRFRREMVAAAPDLVFIEYAVNAYYGPEVNFKAIDGMVLQLLRAPKPPDIVFVYVGDKDWKPSTGWASDKIQPVGRHYGFPEAFLRAHLQTKIDAGEVKWEDISGDAVHPNRTGHTLYAEALIALLKEQMARTGEPTPLPPVPPPFYSDEWVTADVIPVSAAKAEGPWKAREARGQGQRFFSEYLECEEPGATLTVTARTTAFAIVVMPETDGGRYAWSVDGGPERAAFLGVKKEQHGGVWTAVAAEGLPVGEHALQITVKPKEKEATNNWVRIGAFGIAQPKAD